VNEYLPESLWRATAPEAPATASLSGNAAVDVAIIGAGFSGLRAALCLAEAGKRVCVLDATDIGYGASGRNGGQVNPIGHESPASIAQRWQGLHDPSYAGRYAQCVLQSADEVFNLIKRHAINCDAEQNGWIRAVHGASAQAEFDTMLAGWNDAGAKLTRLERGELFRLSGTGSYRAGWLAPSGGSVQPLAYARGLADTAIRAGAVIYTRSPVTQVKPDNGGWSLSSLNSTVKADQLILCTNGYTDKLWPGLKQSLVPVVSIQAATEPLTDDQYARILPQRHTFADTRRVIYYFKKTADKRLVFGSAGFSGEQPGQPDMHRIKEGIRNVYPFLDNIKVDYLWGGRIAITQDHLPHIHQPAPGLWCGLGFNGRGVAMSTVMGRLLAELALGADQGSIPVPVTNIKAFPLHRFHRLGAKAVLHWHDYLDRRESNNSH